MGEALGTVEFTEEELSRPPEVTLSELEARKPEETPDELLRRVARLFDVDVVEIRSSSRLAQHVRARHAVWRELRKRLWSTSEIGRFTGHDHTAVAVAVRGIIKCKVGQRDHLR